MPIRVLEPTVAAQIAAGEVVERPASVAKELIENALDAGATRINVEVRGGGLQELKIQDNGSGIPAAEVELAFERHATSKLRAADDLWAIATLGFRGEALPSIASVSQLICVTRTAAEELGTELRIAGGELQSRSARGCSPGTTFSIRNLFYNATVRREFLRSEATEASAITAVVTQYALAYPEVRFTMLLDGRLAVQTSGRGDLREALIDLYGLEVARQLLPVEAAVGEDREAISVRGLVSPPGLTRSSRGYIHLFVNRRAIQPRGQIAMVIEEAYHTLMMKGRHPVAALDIRVHPGVVDVNVHPTKSEVKFRDNARVMSVLGRAIRAALIEGGGVRPWDDPATPAPGEIAQRRFELRRLGDHWERDEPARRDDPTTPGGAVPAWGQQPADWGSQSDDLASRSVGAPAIFAEDGLASAPAPTPLAPKLPPLRAVGQIGQTYIIAEAPDGMYLIDQHAAHERVTYERLMQRHGAAAFDQQNLLIPQTLELPPAAQALLLSNADLLNEWGFAIEDFGMHLKIRAVPAGLRDSTLNGALLEVADHLHGRGGSTPDDWREAMLTTLACHSSIRAGQTLSLEEMRRLIAQLEQCQAPRTCPHGRPTMILLSTSQLERQFGRIK
ncbi:MAG: DNA mismatch repair endonuclease MutL [Kouleothrix sp.]|nr:DNA mismatch repair endonuclease MutL [Kouleothrix sp.]